MELTDKDGDLDREKVVQEARKIVECVLFNSTAATEQRIVDLIEQAFADGVTKFGKDCYR